MATDPIDKNRLKQLLHDYGSLIRIVEALNQQKQILEADVIHLQELQEEKKQLAQQKTTLETETESLASLKAGLNKSTNFIKQELKTYQSESYKLKSQIEKLTQTKCILNEQIERMDQRSNLLIRELEPLEKNLKYKENLDMQINEARISLNALEARLQADARRLKIFDAFLGLVQANDWLDLDAFAAVLPDFLKDSRQKSYSVELLRSHVITQLAGNAFNVISCSNCGGEFIVNKPSRSKFYQCPMCHSMISISIKLELDDILRAQLDSNNAPGNP